MSGSPCLSSKALAQSSVGQPTLAEEADRGIERLGRQLRGDEKGALLWIRQNIQFQNYVGVLKGARGVYLLRAGNSADVALLLAKILGTGNGGLKLRFASCTSVFEEVRRAGPNALVVDSASQIAEGIDDPELRSEIYLLGDIWASAREVEQAESVALAADLAEPLSAIARPPSRPLMTHYWVQVQDKAGWIDLDPTTSQGASPCQPSTVNATLGAELYHKLKIRVVVERRRAERLSTSNALEVALTMEDLAASRIAFAFAEGAPFPVDDFDSSRRKAGEYTPVLRIDNRTEAGQPLFLSTGTTSQPSTSAIGGFGMSLGNAFGNASTASTNRGEPAVDVTGAWLEFEFTGPGHAPVTSRSEVFDRIGVIARASGTAPSADLAELERVDGDYAALSTVWQIGVLLDRPSLEGWQLFPLVEPSTFDGMSANLDRLIRAFPGMRRGLALPSTDALPSADIAPSILLVGVVPSLDEQRRPMTTVLFDALTPFAPTPAGPDHISATAVARDAVSNPLAEKLLAAMLERAPVLDLETSKPLTNALSVTIAARHDGYRPILLKPGMAVPISGISEEARARLRVHIADGSWALVFVGADTTNNVPKTVSWLIDSTTGVVQDEFENGRHQEETEDVIIRNEQRSILARFRELACKIRLPVIVATLALWGPGGNSDAKAIASMMKKMYETAADYEKKGKKVAKLACGRPGFGPPKP